MFGISSQSAEEQREFAEREHIPFPLLSDPQFVVAHAIGLPTFTARGSRYYKRVTLITDRGVVAKVFYPIFPPQRNAADVLAWLQARGRGT